MTTPDHPQSQKSTAELELSQDQELWELLGKSASKEASPLLSRNILRQIRLDEDKTSAPATFWKFFLSPRFLAPSALAGMALTAVLLWNSPRERSATLAKNTSREALPVAVASSLEDSLESELLLAAADTPDLFSDEEVIAMLF